MYPELPALDWNVIQARMVWVRREKRFTAGGGLWCWKVGGDVKGAYFEYLSEHLAEILEMEEPGFTQLKIYRRGLVAKTNIFLGVSGTYRGQIYYMRPSSNISFLRANYDHTGNMQSQLLKSQKEAAITAWKAESEEFKEQWAKQFYWWYDRNFRRLNRMMTPYMWYVGNFVRRCERTRE